MKTARLLLIGLVAIGILACYSGSESAPQISESRPRPLPTATRGAIGLSISNPVPVGRTVVASDGAAITIHGVSMRGTEAAHLTKEWNQFNDDPREGMEYVMIAASVGYEGGDEETLKISARFDFRAVVNGNIVDHADVCCTEDRLDGEMFAGGLIEGPLIFEVPVGVSDMVVIYTVPFEQSYYLAVE